MRHTLYILTQISYTNVYYDEFIPLKLRFLHELHLTPFGIHPSTIHHCTESQNTLQLLAIEL